MPIEFNDLSAQQDRIRAELDRRVAAVFDHCKFIMGPEVEELEAELSAFCGAPEVVSCASGTDALLLALMALKVRPGDVVFCPSFTFAATAEVMPMLGALPFFVDVDRRTFNMAPESLKRCIIQARLDGLRPVGVISVDLFGHPADYVAIEPIVRDNGLWLVADAAQAFGATTGDRVCGAIGDIATTSFFPAKPLGCYGDGGAAFTADPALAEYMRSIRIHGKGKDKYENVRIGMLSRLDTLQAAVLLAKLDVYCDEITTRNEVAERYNTAFKALTSRLTTPISGSGDTPVWAQYTVRLDSAIDRQKFRTNLKEAAVPTAVYYPTPLHQQPAYNCYPSDPRGLPVSEALSSCVVSLPMHPYLSGADQQRIIDATFAAFR